MDTTHLTAAELHEFWRSHVEHWRASGQTKAAYCRAHGLLKHRFSYWHRHLKPAAPTPDTPIVATRALIPVHVAPAVSAEPTGNTGITVRLPAGLGIELGAEFDPATLRAVVQALSS